MKTAVAVAVLLAVAGSTNAQGDTVNAVVIGNSTRPAQTLTPQTARTLEPTIDLATQRTVQYNWTASVMADPARLTVQYNRQDVVTYKTTFTRTAAPDGVTQNGTITLTNTNPFAVIIYGVRAQITPDGGRPYFVEAQCQDMDNDANTITIGAQLLGAPASAKQVTCTFANTPSEAAGKVQVQYALTRAGSYGYTAPGPVPYTTQNAPLVRVNECALVFDTFATGVPTPRDAPQATAVQPASFRQGRGNLASSNVNAPQICQTTEYSFVAVVGPFAQDACGSKQLYYSAFVYPVSFRSQRSGAWDEAGAYSIARISTPVAVEGCVAPARPATVTVQSARAEYVTVDTYRVARSISGLSSNKPTTLVVDYRRGGRLDFTTAIRRTPGSVVQRRIVGNVMVASAAGNPAYSGRVEVFIQQGRRIAAAVTCSSGGTRITVRPGARVTCQYAAVVTAESTASVQGVFTPNNFPRAESSKAIVNNFKNAERVSADPCYNVQEAAQVSAVNPRGNPAPALAVSGNRPPTKATRVCSPTTYKYRFTVPKFRPNQCGRYQLVLNTRVAPISNLENVVIGTATQRQVVFVDVVGCPSFIPGRVGINAAVAGVNIAQTVLSSIADLLD